MSQNPRSHSVWDFDYNFKSQYSRVIKSTRVIKWWCVDTFYKRISILALCYRPTESHPPMINCGDSVNKGVFRQSIVEWVILKTESYLECVCVLPRGALLLVHFRSGSLRETGFRIESSVDNSSFVSVCACARAQTENEGAGFSTSHIIYIGGDCPSFLFSPLLVAFFHPVY